MKWLPGLVAASLVGCAPGGPSAQSPVQPLMLPWQSAVAGTGVFISLWVFAVPLAESPPVVGTQGIIRAFSWGGQDVGNPVSARSLDVATSMSGGSFSFSLDGVASNDVDVVVNGRVVARAPATPQLVPWLPNSNSVFIVAENFGSGRLVTPEGEPLPPSSFTCERAAEALREVAMRCEVFRRGPLEPAGFSGASVRATVDTPSGPMLTAEVRLP
ncbi:MAG: hypothetical protein SFW67_09175 [Myxococcaceae bacterium]|nr:hypothetical protein [Myxococcaceae bacterium]